MTPRNIPDIWVIGFPKSGNTWISYLCSYCFNLPFYNYGDPNASQHQSWVKKSTEGGNEWSVVAEYRSVQKTHKEPNQVPVGRGYIVYAIRDPRDVFVSYHYFMRSANAGFLGRLRYFLLGLLGKQHQIKWFLSKWNNHLQVWADQIDMIISYDKLLSEGPDYLGKLFSADPFNVNEAIVLQAYEKFSFKNMTGGRKPGSEDSKSFFRKGISGDWQNHFTAREVKLFDNALEIYRSNIS